MSDLKFYARKMKYGDTIRIGESTLSIERIGQGGSRVKCRIKGPGSSQGGLVRSLRYSRDRFHDQTGGFVISFKRVGEGRSRAQITIEAPESVRIEA